MRIILKSSKALIFEHFFKNNTNLLSSDGFHFGSGGGEAYRQQWANQMVSQVYNGPTLPPLRPMPTPPANSAAVFTGFVSGGKYIDSRNVNWTLLDQASFTYNGTISGTSDPTLYRTYKNGPSFSFNLPNGDYVVILKFAEHEKTAAGQRVFTVSINGTRVLTNFDILTQVSPHTPLDKTFPVTVTNGSVSISFTSVIGTPIASAVQVLPAQAFSPTPTPTVQPSPSPTPSPSPAPTRTPSPSPTATPCIKVGDFNNDCIVDAIDLSIMLSFYRTGDFKADLNHDGRDSIADFSVFASAYGK